MQRQASTRPGPTLSPLPLRQSIKVRVTSSRRPVPRKKRHFPAPPIPRPRRIRPQPRPTSPHACAVSSHLPATVPQFPHRPCNSRTSVLSSDTVEAEPALSLPNGFRTRPRDRPAPRTRRDDHYWPPANAPSPCPLLPSDRTSLRHNAQCGGTELSTTAAAPS